SRDLGSMERRLPPTIGLDSNARCFVVLTDDHDVDGQCKTVALAMLPLARSGGRCERRRAYKEEDIAMMRNKSPPPREPTARDREVMKQVSREIAEHLLEKTRADAMKQVLDRAQLKLIDRWIVNKGDPVLDRMAAMRRLVEIGLKAKANRSKCGRRV